VLDNARDAIVSIDVQGTISLFNRAGEIMFGRTSAEVMGRNIRLLLSESFQEEYDDYLDSFLHAGSARSIATRREVYGMRKDGSTFPIELAITGFELDQQRYFICILRDISERKKLEEH
jgi:PAS domain S-box-containing protein